MEFQDQHAEPHIKGSFCSEGLVFSTIRSLLEHANIILPNAMYKINMKSNIAHFTMGWFQDPKQ